MPYACPTGVGDGWQPSAPRPTHRQREGEGSGLCIRTQNSWVWEFGTPERTRTAFGVVLIQRLRWSGYGVHSRMGGDALELTALASQESCRV